MRRKFRPLARRKAPKSILLGAATVVALCAAAPAQAATATLVKDIRSGGTDSSPQNLANVAGRLFFAARDATHGFELWKSDGTAAGTKLVKDINPGSGNSSPSSLTNVAGTAFFTATTPTRGTELWKSDGTAAGTMLVKDINPGAASSIPDPYYHGGNLTNVAGKLFFVASDPTHGFELWKSDGTAAGTNLVKDIYPGSESSLLFEEIKPELAAVGGTLFFRAAEPIHGSQIWKSDGTAAATKVVTDINPGVSYPAHPTNVAGTLFFSADTRNLWKSDGTGTGTKLLKQFTGDSYSVNNLIDVAGKLFFSAPGGLSSGALWKSDGTTAGTQLVKDIQIYVRDLSSATELTNVAGKLFLPANDGTHGYELWKSDGTTAGTNLIKDIYPGYNYEDYLIPNELTNVAGTLFFSPTEPTHGRELWKSDGTAAGTTRVKDINYGAADSTPEFLTNVAGTLFFSATEPAHGRELWKAVP